MPRKPHQASIRALITLLLGLLPTGCSNLLPGTAQSQADVFVAPDGDDSGPGTQARPFASLNRARLAVRELLSSRSDRDIVVLLRGGVYPLQRTVVFSREDSAPAGHTVTYAACPGEKPVLTSGLPLRQWQRVREVVPGQTPETSGRLWSTIVPAELKEVSVLFDGDRRLPRARSRGFVPPPAASCKEHGAHTNHLHFPAGAIPRWSTGRNWDLIVMPTSPWVMNILPITHVDEAQRLLQTDVPATYPLGEVKFGCFPDGTAWIENAVEGLDEPGEWVFDATTRRIYLWPSGGEPSDHISAPLLTEFVRIEGRIDPDGPADQAVRGIVLRGLSFTHGGFFRWVTDKAGRGLQHDWEMFDQPTAMLRLRGAEDCVVEGCRFVNSGGAAVRLDLHAQRNTVRGNLIAHVGGVGILLAGYGPGTKHVNRLNQVSGNHIHHVGELLWHSPAVFVWQSGENLIAGNLIHHCPYTAIVVSGRILWDRSGKGECSRTIRWSEIDSRLGPSASRLTWAQREPFLHGRRNIVEHNEIHQVMQTLGDGNCIYVSGTGGGNAVRCNFLHDVESPNINAAIRCDDDQHGTTITRNVVWNTCGEGFISKGNNTITNNIVAGLRKWGGQGCEPRHQRGFLVLPYGDVTGSVISLNIFYSTDPTMRLAFENPKSPLGPTLLRQCQLDQNVYFCPADAHWAGKHLEEQRQHGVERHSIEADPRFANVEKGDFRLSADSPAVRLGFEPIAPRRIDRTIFPFSE